MGQSVEICVPDIGDFEDVEVVEILVSKGDVVDIDDPLVSIESEKATMEIPSTAAGVVSELRVAEGDRVSEGSVLVLLDVEGAIAEMPSKDASRGEPVGDESTPSESPSAPELDPADAAAADTATAPEPAAMDRDDDDEPLPDLDPHVAPVVPAHKRPISPAAANPFPDRPISVHASPLVRRYARELGVPLGVAEGTGPRGRVLVDDLKRTVAERFAGDSDASAGAGLSKAGIPEVPVVDFAAFGPVREEPLTRIQKVSGPGLHRSWLNVPHVTQHDEADVTKLERFRKDRQAAASELGLKLSPLLFVMKAVVATLREFPAFRASLAAEGDRLWVKDYFHLGIAVDTAQGLVVPVIRDVDQKGIFELASELSSTAARARDRKLAPDDLRGAVFTISSLGGIGGSGFSPIVNAPEVAILGLSKTRVQPVWTGAFPLDGPANDDASTDTQDAAGPDLGRFEPRLVLPISLSYDHRVIDGAAAVRFTTRLTKILSDPLMLLL